MTWNIRWANPDKKIEISLNATSVLRKLMKTMRMPSSGVKDTKSIHNAESTSKGKTKCLNNSCVLSNVSMCRDRTNELNCFQLYD